jgi:hypothetical protein
MASRRVCACRRTAVVAFQTFWRLRASERERENTMRIIQYIALCVAFGFTLPALAADAPARIMIVGLYHFSNPGRDILNTQSDDVTTPERQQQLVEITDALTRFKPTLVGVEWPAALVDERYAKYLDGTLEPSANEVVQLGFRLAQGNGLKRVHGLDVDGEFPFEAVQQWASAHGRSGEIDALMALGKRETDAITAMQKAHSIGATLRELNTDRSIATSHSFYTSVLTMGSDAEQPGAELMAAWYARNVKICARLLQVVKPGDRAVVFYGAGHLHFLKQCVSEAPGVLWVTPLDYLPR